MDVLRAFGSGKKANLKKYSKYFTINVHSVQPWPSQGERGKSLELVWKIEKQQGKIRATISRHKDEKMRKLASMCQFHEPFEVKIVLCQYPDGFFEKKALIIKLFEVDSGTGNNLISQSGGKNRSNLGTCVLDLAHFLQDTAEETTRRMYRLSVPKSVSGAIGKAYIDITVAVADSRGMYSTFNFNNCICEHYVESDDDQVDLVDEGSLSIIDDLIKAPPKRTLSPRSSGLISNSKDISPRSSKMSREKQRMNRSDSLPSGNLHRSISNTTLDYVGSKQRYTTGPDQNNNLQSDNNSSHSSSYDAVLAQNDPNETLPNTPRSSSRGSSPRSSINKAFQTVKSFGSASRKNSFDRNASRASLIPEQPKSDDIDFKEQLLRNHLSVKTNKDRVLNSRNIPNDGNFRRDSVNTGVISVARGVQTDADMYISGSGLYESKQQRMRAEKLEEELEQVHAKLSVYTMELKQISALELAIHRPNEKVDEQFSMVKNLVPAILLAKAAFGMATSSASDTVDVEDDSTGAGRSMNNLVDKTTHESVSATSLSFSSNMLYALKRTMDDNKTKVTRLSSWWLNVVILQSWLPLTYDRRELCRIEQDIFQITVDAVWNKYVLPALQLPCHTHNQSYTNADGKCYRDEISSSNYDMSSDVSKLEFKLKHGSKKGVERWEQVLDVVFRDVILWDFNESSTRSQMASATNQITIVQKELYKASQFFCAQVLIRTCREIDMALFLSLVLGTETFERSSASCVGGKQTQSEFKAHYTSLPINGPLNFEMGLALKIAVTRWCESVNKELMSVVLKVFGKRKKKTRIHKSEEDGSNVQQFRNSNPGHETESAITYKLFPFLICLSNVLLLPKDALIDPAIRREMCPKFTSSTLKEILIRYLPDIKGNGPASSVVSDVLLGRLDNAIVVERSMQSMKASSDSTFLPTNTQSSDFADQHPAHVNTVLHDCYKTKHLKYKSKNATDLMPDIGVADRWRRDDFMCILKQYKNSLGIKTAMEQMRFNFLTWDIFKDDRDVSSIVHTPETKEKYVDVERSINPVADNEMKREELVISKDKSFLDVQRSITSDLCDGKALVHNIGIDKDDLAEKEDFMKDGHMEPELDLERVTNNPFDLIDVTSSDESDSNTPDNTNDIMQTNFPWPMQMEQTHDDSSEKIEDDEMDLC